MAAKICKRPYKIYSSSSILSLLGCTFFKSISLLENLDKLYKLLILFGYPTFTPNTAFLFF